MLRNILLSLCLTVSSFTQTLAEGPPTRLPDVFKSDWDISHDRVWAGSAFWANRLHDWKISDGKLECVRAVPRLKMRTVHLLTHRVSKTTQDFALNVRLELIAPQAGKTQLTSAGGFLIGVGGNEMDYRAASIIHNVRGKGAGIFAGVNAEGEVFFQDYEKGGVVFLGKKGKAGGTPRDVILQLTATRAVENNEYGLNLISKDAKTNKELSQTAITVKPNRVVGGFALVSHPGNQPQPKTAGRFAFQSWRVAGKNLDVNRERQFGPILTTQYTLSRNVLKLTAQLPPLGERDNQRVQLQIKKNGKWNKIAETKIIRPGFTAPFRVPDWDSTKDTPYRVVYNQKFRGKNNPITYDWQGIIRKDPINKESIVVAGFTGNHNNSHAINRQPFNWPMGMWFPHNEVTKHVAMHKPDVLFFSGDQVYEGASPTFADRANIKLDYLYKWYLWCWAYRDLTRDIPSICIPDDHDVYQGNIWGEGGRKTKQDHFGGYVHPADFVKMVERTQTSHLPDAFDPTPVKQGIGVYYSDMVYGRISFAILEDRKFKSGCARPEMPPSGTARPDHVISPKWDLKKADAPHLKLLGDRQLKFLNHWNQDWRGADMKIAVSQTIFANMATHHGPGLQYLLADMDSNGWPPSKRDLALMALRKGFAFHLGGDQHLATIVHHGIEKHNDSIWSFCVPSVANFYPRMWNPKAVGVNRPKEAQGWQGEHLDGFRNRVTVYAATNPGPKTGQKPADLHDKMPGYGIVRLNKAKRTITMECWPRYVNPLQENAKQYEGWPRTITQEDNYSRKAAGYLPEIQVKGMANPVIQVINDESKEVIYTIRIQGQSYRPKVFAEGKYTIKVGELGTDKVKTLSGIQASVNAKGEKTVDFTD